MMAHLMFHRVHMHAPPSPPPPHARRSRALALVRLYACRLGVPLARCIEEGLVLRGEGRCGIAAGDEECYSAFGAIFEPVILVRGCPP